MSSTMLGEANKMKVTACYLAIGLVLTLGACATMKAVGGKVVDGIKGIAGPITAPEVAPEGAAEEEGDDKNPGVGTTKETVKDLPLYLFTLMGMAVASAGYVLYRVIKR